MARGILALLFGLLVLGFLVIRLVDRKQERPPREWVEKPAEVEETPPSDTGDRGPEPEPEPVIVASSIAAAPAVTADNCPATKTLSKFEKAANYARNDNTAALDEMMGKGDYWLIPKGARGEVEERRELNQIPIARFVYDGNPNGIYGMWTLQNCLREVE